MALNIYEELDLSSGADDIPEGFLKVKNNWESWDTELGNARDGKSTLITKLDSLSPLTGYARRSQFTYVDGDTITIGGGAYDVNGTLAKITSELTSEAHGQTGTKFIYLYIGYSYIPSNGVLDNGDLVWSGTAPTWSHSLLGWYNGNDRCIFSVYIDGSDDIEEFFHSGDMVQFSDFVADFGAATLTTSYSANALTIPAFGAMKAQVIFQGIYVDGTSTLRYAPANSSSPGTTAHRVLRCEATETNENTIAVVITDSSQQILLSESANTANLFYVRTIGWTMPKGM